MPFVVYIPLINLLAFGFGNLAMLGWLGAAAAPILIHLWMRHKHRDTPWAAMEFLRAAIKRNARRLKLQQWLLLAIRTLLLLLLALAAAKPYLSGWNLLTGSPAMHRVLVLDASMSMQYTTEDETMFDRAKRLAGEVLENARPGDLFSVCLLADPPQIIVASPVSDARHVAAQLAALEPTFGTASLANTLATVQELVDEIDSEQRNLSAREVMVFTDFASHSWDAAVTEPETAKQLEQLAAEGQVTIVDVGTPTPANVALSELQLAGSLATTVEPVRLVCNATNFSDSPAENVLVQLTVGGITVDEQAITLPAGGQATLAFDVQLTEPGWQTLSVRTAGDALAADDQAWLSIKVPRRVRTLLVEGSPGAARYLRHAIDPSGSSASPIEALVVPESALVETPLEDFDCIFLCNVARFTTSERQLLDRYTRHGGSLVFFLGDRVLTDTYNEVLANSSSESGLAPLEVVNTSNRNAMELSNLLAPTAAPRLHAIADTSTDIPALLPATIGPLQASSEFGLNPLGYRHPIAAAFRGSERAGLLSTPVSRYYQLEPALSAEVVLALPGGDPFLVTTSRGAGMVAVVATSASLDTIDPATAQPWTMLPAWPSFLPIVRELVAYGVTHGQQTASLATGEPIGGTLAENWVGASVIVARPDDRTDTVPVVRQEATAEWSYASTDVPGAYAMQSPTSDNILEVAAVNVPAAESNLSRIDTALLPEAIDIRTIASISNRTAADLIGETSIHRLLLYAVLVLLLVESVLAWAFAGRGA